jgi:hypothetical protein
VIRLSGHDGLFVCAQSHIPDDLQCLASANDSARPDCLDITKGHQVTLRVPVQRRLGTNRFCLQANPDWHEMCPSLSGQPQGRGIRPRAFGFVCREAKAKTAEDAQLNTRIRRRPLQPLGCSGRPSKDNPAEYDGPNFTALTQTGGASA